MNIIEVFNGFQTQEQAVEYLEKIRWNGRPTCPYCRSDAVGRHASGDRAGMRWQCRRCTRAFSATVGTIFHGTHVPLRNWFLCLALMMNAKKSASAYQIARDLGMRRPTVWSMMHRIRVAMANDPAHATPAGCRVSGVLSLIGLPTSPERATKPSALGWRDFLSFCTVYGRSTTSGGRRRCRGDRLLC